MEEKIEKRQLEVQAFWSALATIGSVFYEVSSAINKFAEEHKEELKALIYYVQNIEEYVEMRSGIWKAAAENGWFPNEYISIDFERYVDQGQEALDSYMLKELSLVISDIHASLIKSFPERKHIIDVAFELHSQRNYVAAIPLLLSQTDGICCQKIGSYLFTEHDKRIDKIQEVIKKSPEKSVILAPILQNTQFGKSIDAGKKLKDKAPNRSGILHGSRKHLDYGTEVNSFKCISLLSYVSKIFDDE